MQLFAGANDTTQMIVSLQQIVRDINHLGLDCVTPNPIGEHLCNSCGEVTETTCVCKCYSI